MHELLLFGQVPFERHTHILKILAGLAGMQPQRVIERHLVFRPRRSPTSRNTQVGASQGIQNQQMQALQGQLQGELFYLKLVSEIGEDWVSKNGSVGRNEDPAEDTVIGGLYEQVDQSGRVPRSEYPAESDSRERESKSPSWSLRFSDLPEVGGRRPVTSRMIAAIDVIEGDPIRFMDAYGYNYVSEYVLEGHRLIHNNIILLFYHILRFPADMEVQTDPASDSTTNGSSAAPREILPPYASLLPLDSTNAFVLQASIRVQDGNKVEPMTLGMTELKGFKDSMRGVVDLEVGDRLALDTRFR
ncbi:MAG: Mediator of RNA polymerase II transcription subunit 18 [Sclerophora amabilis]|nr:MAG: Mediator of RNA polymerase II transcription subunit 18 [Sclerophora amabilis]